jgi:hypothetical protein
VELLPAIVGLAALDSINPSALLATVALLERLRDRQGGTAREALLWVLGLAGFFLLADALGRFQVIG